MKSYVTPPKKGYQQIDYPCFARLDYKREDEIVASKVVLFTSRASGTVFASEGVWSDPNDRHNKIGTFCDDWYPLDAHDSGWEILPPGTEIKIVV